MNSRLSTPLLLVLALSLVPAAAYAQIAEADRRVQVASGQSVLLQPGEPITRVSVSDPEIVEAIVISPVEVQLNARKPGSATVIIWTKAGERRLWIVESEVDGVRARNLVKRLYPAEAIDVLSVGSAVVLSGEVESGVVRAGVEEAMKSLGIPVVNNLRSPAPRQVMLQVRFAEVSRSSVRELGSNLLRLAGDTEGLNASGLDRLVQHGEFDVTLSDAVSLALFDPSLSLGLVVKALQSNGTFNSLAEPNLIAVEGEEAQFLAGGEFPFPVAQGDGQNVTIQFKEFGVRLRFRADVDGDRIRLDVEPEVSSLDFGNSIESSGFRVPSILARRAKTVVDLKDGQTFAIAGLMNHELTNNAEKVPFLGSIPIIGRLFASRDVRERRTELLVLVTPRLVSPDFVAPTLPGGEPSEWDWSRGMRNEVPRSEPLGVPIP